MLQSFKLALKSIWSNKVRSALTMFGIIIGVSSVIILVSLMNGYLNSQISQWGDLGANNINVSVINQPSRSVTMDEMYAYLDEHKDLFAGMSPTVTPGGGTLKVGSKKLENTGLTGVSESYADLVDKKIAKGRFLSYADVASKQEVCVLGAYTAQRLFGSGGAALGETVSFAGVNLAVVGVLEQKSKGKMEESGTDDVLLLPYSTALKMAHTAQPSAYLFASKSTDKAAVLSAKKSLQEYLYSVFRNKKNYNLMAMAEMLDQINRMMAQMSVLIGGIAGISLFVAGVGVMNIMLVSVTERTREIGIRKALGARPGVILQQFVLEAITTSVLGGLIGIGIGSGILNIVTMFLGYSVAATPNAVFISFTVSVAIGLIFGYMPAKRAASLNPIDALRSE